MWYWTEVMLLVITKGMPYIPRCNQDLRQLEFPTEAPLPPMHLIIGIVTMIGAFFLSLPFAMVLGLGTAMRGDTATAAVEVLIGAGCAGVLSGVIAAHKYRTKGSQRNASAEWHRPKGSILAESTK